MRLLRLTQYMSTYTYTKYIQRKHKLTLDGKELTHDGTEKDSLKNIALEMNLEGS